MLLNNAKTCARTSIVDGIRNVCTEEMGAKSVERGVKALALPAQSKWRHVC